MSSFIVTTRGMGEKPSPLPACAEAPACALRAGRAEGCGLHANQICYKSYEAIS